jgi:toxin ParE1/3/4
MAFRVMFTEVAAEDLESISEYITQNDSEAARRVCAGLYDLALSLGRNPFMGRMTPEYGDPSIRDMVRGNYRIVYVVLEAAQTIQIIRFWHGSRGYLPKHPSIQEDRCGEPQSRWAV